MAAAGRGVVVVAMSDFGRRVRANRSGGTDHGHGGCWFVMGDGVLGGRMAGRWPGLKADQMDQGLDLAVANDYRMVLGETLAFVGLNAGAAFPDYKPTGKSLGLFG